MVDNMYSAIYARVSSEDQGKGYSLPTQVEECLALAKKAGVKLLFVLHQREGSAEGTLFFHMRGALAEYERAKIMERMRRGRIGRSKAGHPNGGTVPLGYHYVSEPHKGRFEIDEEEAAIVRRIFDLCLKGKPTRAIACILSQERIPTKKDRGAKAGRIKVAGQGQWGWSTISDILSYEGYTGRAFWNKRRGQEHARRDKEEWIEYQIPAIISEETFRAAQIQLAKNKALAKRNRKYEYLFTGGRLRCGRCGRAMTGQNPDNKCRRYRCCSNNTYVNVSLDSHCKGYVRADEVEGQVWQAVMNVLQKPELITAEVERQQANTGELQAEVEHEMGLVESALAKCDKEERRWAEAYANEVISLAELKGYKEEISARRGSLQAQETELQARLEAIALVGQKTESLIVYCERVKENLKTFDFNEKRLALEALDIRATWTPGQPLDIQASISFELCSSQLIGT